MNTLPQRDTRALIEALRIRALALTGERWERDATREMMKEAAQRLEDLNDLPDILSTLQWAERQLSALVTDDDGDGVFIRGTGTELAGFGAGMANLRAVIAELQEAL